MSHAKSDALNPLKQKDQYLHNYTACINFAQSIYYNTDFVLINLIWHINSKGTYRFKNRFGVPTQSNINCTTGIWCVICLTNK